MTVAKTFAERMIQRRKSGEEKKLLKARTQHLEDGALEKAWSDSYRLTHAQMGPPSFEKAEGDDYFLMWEKPGSRVMLNLGLAYRFMKCATRRQTVMSIVENATAVLQANRTSISFMLCVPSKDFPDFEPLQWWAESKGHRPLHVISGNDGATHLFIRSVGTHDWFGQVTSKRPVIILDIP